MTPFGGAVWVPIAERRSERTTTIRVNEVTITRTEGERQHRDERDELSAVPSRRRPGRNRA